ncbi:hypothetical protein KKG45_06675 [bacterium]|nr:hypothetical protein [bacterium]MBU1072912.1 hypothetical protein [bacterium]MBU1677019.1 hypothetical protein [bacterium]
MRILITLALLAAPLWVAAADLSDLAWLEGEWQGYSLMGETSNVNHKEFRFAQAGRYLVERTLAMFPPAEPSTDYETHQDMTVFYAIGGELRSKGFFAEGLVQSSAVTVDGPRVIIESTEVEGGPPGMRARLVYERAGYDRFTGVFEVDWSGGGYECYQTYEFSRLR